MSMHSEVENMLLEMKSDKAQPKQKAFHKMDNILNGRLKELKQVILNSNSLSWQEIYSAAHSGIQSHARKLMDKEVMPNMNDPKISIYSKVLINICNIISNPVEPEIPFDVILANTIDIFREEPCMRYYGAAYLKMLQDNVLKEKNNLVTIPLQSWTDIVDSLFKLIRVTKKHSISVVDIAVCLQHVFKFGCDQSQLGTVISDYLEKLRVQLEKRDDDREKLELLIVGYYICRNVIVDNRFDVCRFTEAAAKYIHQIFKVELRESNKLVLFKLMDLSLLAHYPNLHDTTVKIEYVHDKQQWFTQLRNYAFMLGLEMRMPPKTRYRHTSMPEVDQVIAQFGARLSYLVYWKDEIWEDLDKDTPSASKRLKHAQKLQSLMDFVQPTDNQGEFNWKWLTIIAELIYNYPAALDSGDYQPLLNLLTQCQSKIEYDFQVYVFAKCCYTLLNAEKKFLSTANIIIINFCKDLWNKIADATVRVCTSNIKYSVQNHALLQILLHFQKSPSHNFIEEIIKIFITNSTIKTDATLKSLIAVLKFCNLDLLQNGKELTTKILAYTLEKPNLSTLMKIITPSGNEKPSANILAQLSTLCCLSKSDIINYENNSLLDSEELFNSVWKLDVQKNYKHMIQEMERYILMKCNERLLIEESDFLQTCQEEAIVDPKKMIIPTELKCIIDQVFYEELMKLTDVKKKILEPNSCLDAIEDYLKQVLESNALLMNLLDNFLHYEAMNSEKLYSSFITKKIDYQLQEIEQLFDMILKNQDELDLKDTYQLLVLLKSMFGSNHHHAVSKKIREYNLGKCFQWVAKQINNNFVDADDENEATQIGWSEFTNAKTQHKIKFMAIDVLCQYNNFEGPNSDEIMEHLKTAEFDDDNNIDLHIVFHVCKLFSEQTSVSEEMITWILNPIYKICKFHHNHDYLSRKLIEALKYVIKLAKGHHDITSNVIVLYYSFSCLCTEKYNPIVSVNYLEMFKYFHKQYFHLYVDEQQVITMYDNIAEKFLDSNTFAVRMAAIKIICVILQNDIENCDSYESSTAGRNSKKEFFKNFFKYKKIQYTGTEMEVNVSSDDAINKISSHLQLFTSLFCSNFVLRKEIILELSKLFLTNKLSDEMAQKVLQKILKFLNCDARSLMDQNSLIHLLSQWLINGYAINSFPWYFIGCTSMMDFVQEHYKHILLAILKINCRVLDVFLTSIEMSGKVAIQPLLSQCFSYILPVQAGCAIKYEAKAAEMKNKLDVYFTKEEQQSVILRETAAIIIHLLENVYDRDYFREICGFELEIFENSELIDATAFDRCLNFLKTNFKTPANQNLFTFFCYQRAHFIEKMLMQQKDRIRSTSLKEHKILYLLQYCMLVEKLVDYLQASLPQSQTGKNIKDYTVREITFFLCCMILNDQHGLKLRETATTFLLIFLKKILPAAAPQVETQLNQIITSLVSICKKSKGTVMTSFENKCMAVIKFLVINQKQSLNDQIADLDTFPDSPEFVDLRECQLEAKYHGKSFTLVEEIQHFLKIKKRKIEGLIELRHHLADKKSELALLFKEISSALQFSEDAENNILHQLIRSLVGYARNASEDEERSIAAIKCLGEIGVYDLGTMVFITEDQNVTIYEPPKNIQQCQKKICHVALEQMEKMILHHDPQVFNLASTACYNMLEMQTSQGYEPSVYLRPYQTNTITRKCLFYEQPKSGQSLEFRKVLQECEFSSYPIWIKRLCGSMMIFSGCETLEPVSNVQKSFAELMAPMMVQLLLCYDDEAIVDELLTGVGYFFGESAEKQKFLDVHKGSMFIDKLAIRQMLKFTECIRTHCQKNPNAQIAQRINLNFLNVAKAAKYCEAFFTAVMYCEMWVEKQLKNEKIPHDRSINNKNLQEIMYESYTAIGIHDASELFVNLTTNRSLYLQTCHQGIQNIFEHDTMKNDGKANLLKLLNDTGLHFMANTIAKASKDPSLKAQQYECLWRLGEWEAVVDNDVIDPKTTIDHHEEFEKNHFLGLKCLKNDDELGMKTAIQKSRKSILHIIQQESLECTKNLYKFLGMSHLLQQIEDFSEVRFRRVPDSHEKLINKWTSQNKLPHDFKLIEPILSQRNSIYDTANLKSGRRSWIPEALQDNMLHILRESIESGCKNDAIKTIAKLRALPKISRPTKAEMLILEAQLHCNTNLNLAKHSLICVIQNQEFEQEILLKSIACRFYGVYLAESHADEILKIYEEYFARARDQLEKYARHQRRAHLIASLSDDAQVNSQQSQPQETEEDENSVDQKIKKAICVFDVIAKYIDREYISKCDYMASPDFQNKMKTFDKNTAKLKVFESEVRSKNSTDDKRKTYHILKRSLEIDDQEIKNTGRQRDRAAEIAMYHYVRGAISDPDDNVLSIFRIISIWLANPESSFIKDLLDQNLLRIPSYKFIIALPQLVVRLSDSDDDINKLLRNLVEQCALDHPHQTLPLILALVNSYADTDMPGRGTQEPRVVGAIKLWSSLKKQSKLASTMQQMENMASGLIDLANKQCTSTMPPDHPVLKLANLNFVQCPTISLITKKDCNYNGCITSVIKWDAQITSVGGINAPKKINCLCSDGIQHPQLLKGRDDMRQDAVMQQVFGVVNQLLNQNKEMKKRHARIRTYKVVPFSRRSGILEWCRDTTPIGLYLVGNRKVIGAHKRCRPQDWTPEECIQLMTKYDAAQFPKKLEIFNKICDNMQPVFQNFFHENYTNPGKWFERRLAYTTSVAVSSIVGYILGIGDRHVQNILIDLNTAEVIHIDFGIAFEQGRILPHPELIPFRLTRDIVAPMGVAGVNGVFRKTCEKTLEILRNNETMLTTILEVLLYDPLYAWTMSTRRARRNQLEAGENFDDDTSEIERDSTASRALQRIQTKLKGQADDSFAYSSVEGQVESLIQKATSPALLSRLFKGWQPYI